MVSAYEVEKDISMSPGDEYVVGDNVFLFQGVEPYNGPNFAAQRGRIEVTLGSGRSLILNPEKRTFMRETNPMTEAAIDPGLTRDLYVSLGEPLGNEAWAVRIYYKPYIRFIWLGCLFMAFGAMFGAMDKRYRLERVTAREAIAGARAT